MALAQQGRVPSLSAHHHRNRSGPAVVVVTESGHIHAWDGEGSSVQGFPILHPGGSLFAPVSAT
jgi:hypothetical protein